MLTSRFARANPRFAFGDLGLGVASAAVGGLILALASANKSLVEMDRVARVAGLSLQKLQEIQFAGREVGIGSGDINSGVEKLARSLNEARREENELTKFLDQNNVKWRDREGAVIGVNQALIIAADLINRASTEADKLDIAKRMQIPESFIPLLERGAGQFIVMQNNAKSAGAVIDDSLVKKAVEFDTAWTQVSANFETRFKAAILRVGGEIMALGRNAREAFDRAFPNNRLPNIGHVLTNKPPEPGPSSGPYGSLPTQFSTPGQQELLQQLLKKYSVATTDLSKPEKGGSVGPTREGLDSVEAYISALHRQTEILRVEADVQQKSAAEREIAIRILEAEHVARRAGIELTDEQRRRIEEEARARVMLTERIKENKAAQDAYNDAARFAGGEILNAFEGLILEGKSLKQVLDDITKSLIKAALQAAILGDGPLAGLMGLKGQNGQPGGLIGSLMNFGGPMATGGPVSGRKTYLVGENGPELFAPGQNGHIIPNKALAGAGGGGAPPVVNVYAPPGSSVETRQSSAGGRQVTDVIISAVTSDIASNGPIGKMLQGRYGLNRARGR